MLELYLEIEKLLAKPLWATSVVLYALQGRRGEE